MEMIRYEAVRSLVIEMMWDAAIENHRINCLRKAIDDALDTGDLQAFYWLSSQLKEADHAGSEG